MNGFLHYSYYTHYNLIKSIKSGIFFYLCYN